jgi:hypothetical protein
MKPITQVTQFFNVAKKGISYGKVVRSVLFLILVVTIGLSAKENPFQSSLVALLAFIAFDVICLFHKKDAKLKDLQVKELEARMNGIEKVQKDINSDLSVAKISTAIGSAKRR